MPSPTSGGRAAFQPAGGAEFVAHRGGLAPGCPENTLVAIRRALALGVKAVEVDLRATRDGRLVLMHDKTVDRTTNGRGRVGELTLADIKRLDAGDGERVPTYEEVLDLLAGTGVTLVLDVKRGPPLDRTQLVEEADGHGVTGHLVIGVRRLDDLTAFRALSPEARTLALVRTSRELEAFARDGADILRLWPEWIEADHHLVDRVHALGGRVWVTAGGAGLDELRRLVALGVDGVLSDRPELAAACSRDGA
ncbi:MAG: glycerophosphodiester phosphodiesterase [Planctomycetota bacterium]